MKSDAHIVSYSPEQLSEMKNRGEDRTDWSRVKAITDNELESAIANDPDEAGMTVDWDAAVIATPSVKKMMTMRVDADVLDFFQSMGRGYQTRINAILRSYMEHAKR